MCSCVCERTRTRARVSVRVCVRLIAHLADPPAQRASDSQDILFICHLLQLHHVERRGERAHHISGLCARIIPRLLSRCSLRSHCFPCSCSLFSALVSVSRRSHIRRHRCTPHAARQWTHRSWITVLAYEGRLASTRALFASKDPDLLGTRVEKRAHNAGANAAPQHNCKRWLGQSTLTSSFASVRVSLQI